MPRGNPKGVGRPKGTRNKKGRALRQAVRSGQTPLEYLLSVMSDVKQKQPARIDAAKAAAPYCHARLQSITVQEKPFEGDPNELTSEYLAHIIATGSSGDALTTAKGKGKPH